jgi:hypothetical protein
VLGVLPTSERQKANDKEGGTNSDERSLANRTHYNKGDSNGNEGVASSTNFAHKSPLLT